ncbi:MAG: hypothetical protein QM752_05205 [Gammaproteobacteria bacterium]
MLSPSELKDKIDKLHAVEISGQVVAGFEKQAEGDIFPAYFLDDKNSFYLEKPHQLIHFKISSNASDPESKECVRWALWDLATHKIASMGRIKSVAFSDIYPQLTRVVMLSSGEHFALGGSDGTISIFNLKTQNIDASHKAHGGAIYDMCYDPHSNCLITSAADPSIFVTYYDVTHHKFTHANPKGFPLEKPAFSIQCAEGEGRLYTVEGDHPCGNQLKQRTLHDGKLTTVSTFPGQYHTLLKYHDSKLFYYKHPDYLGIYSSMYGDDEKIRYPDDQPVAVHFVTDKLLLVKTLKHFYLYQHQNFRAFQEIARISSFIGCDLNHVALPNKTYSIRYHKDRGLLSLYQLTSPTLCEILSSIQKSTSIKQLTLMDHTLDDKSLYGLHQLTAARKDLKYQFSKELTQQLAMIDKYEGLLEAKTKEIAALTSKQAGEEKMILSKLKELETQLEKNVKEQTQKMTELTEQVAELKKQQKESETTIAVLKDELEIVKSAHEASHLEQEKTNAELLLLLGSSEPVDTEPLIETIKKIKDPDLKCIQRLLAEDSIAYWNLIKFSGNEYFERYAKELREKKAIVSAKDLVDLIQVTDVRSEHSEGLEKALDQLIEEYKSLPVSAKNEMREWVRPQAKVLLEKPYKEKLLEWKKKTFEATFGEDSGMDFSTLPVPEKISSKLLQEVFDSRSSETESLINTAMLQFLRDLKHQLSELPEARASVTSSGFFK